MAAPVVHDGLLVYHGLGSNAVTIGGAWVFRPDVATAQDKLREALIHIGAQHGVHLVPAEDAPRATVDDERALLDTLAAMRWGPAP